MKNLLLSAFSMACLIHCQPLDAQIIGGQRNGQSLPTEVRPSEVSAGGYSGNVNLFTGTYNASYPLGTVSTPTGLSFTATLSYSSTFTSGDNLPHLSGVPYGEGWSIDLPTISVSSEDFNKYTLWGKFRVEKFGMSDPAYFPDSIFTRRYTEEQAKEEGSIYWFNPTLNLPGVGGGRMVYKYSKGDRHYFVLHVFERYVEASFNGGAWEVMLDDGTIYTFAPTVINYRTASNQRVHTDLYAQTDGACDEVDGGDVLRNLVLPKEETLTWHCVKISHRNKIGGIFFKYKTFGGFDYNKIFTKQNVLWDLISGEWFDSQMPHTQPDYQVVYKEVVLTEIDAGHEKLVLDYESIPTTGSDGLLLDIGDTDNVTRLDSMYSSKVVYEASTEAGFEDWLRYYHPKRDYSSNHYPSKRNPYRAEDPNLPTAYLREEILNDEALFSHGYLESPRLEGIFQFVSGDVYEIRSEIGGCGSELSQGAFMDINIATGNHKGIADLGREPVNVDATNYEKVTAEQVFTTFNQAIKWHTHGGSNTPTGNLVTSNYFVMPKLPDDYKGFHLQIGAGNSDTNFDMDPLDVAPDLPNHAEPLVCRAYTDYLHADYDFCNVQQCEGYLKSGHDMPHNFGIGLPWRMLTELYSQWESEYCICPPSNNPGKWWNDTQGFPSEPTLLANDLALERVQLVRYAKNPYMLKSARKLILNGSGFNPSNGQSGWHLAGLVKMEYEIAIAPRYGMSLNGANEIQLEDNGARNVVLLTEIRQEPYGSGGGTPLITKFGYEHNNQFGLNFTIKPFKIPLYFETHQEEQETELSALLSNYHLLNRIEDPLGKLTQLYYKKLGEGSYYTKSFEYRLRPYEDLGSSGGNTVKQAPNHAIQMFMAVDRVVTSEREGLQGAKTWHYKFGQAPIQYSARPPFSGNFVYDYFYSYRAGYAKAEVTGPCEGNCMAPGSGPRTIYKHHTDDLKWGKLFSVETLDGNGDLLSVTETGYEAIPAFESPAHRAFQMDNFDYKEYRLTSQRPAFNGDFASYNSSIWGYLDTLGIVTLDELLIGYEEQFPQPQSPPGIDCDGYDNLGPSEQEECVAYWEAYNNWVLNQPQGPYIPKRYANAPNLFYEIKYARFIEEHAPAYLYSFFLKKASEASKSYDKDCEGSEGLEMATATRFDYFDAQFDGTSTSPGWEVIGAGASALLKEPSWQVYKTETTAQDYSTAEEHFYFWDLVNNEDPIYLSHDTYYPNQGAEQEYNLLWLLYTYNRDRTLAYEKRVTSTAPGGSNKRSTSYVYSTEWEPELGDGELLNIMDPSLSEPCAGANNPPGGGGGGNTGTGVMGNMGLSVPPVFVHKGTGEPCGGGTCNGYCELLHDGAKHLFATPCGILPPPLNYGPGGGHGTNYHTHVPSDSIQAYMNNSMEGKIYLKKIVEQVKPGNGTGLFTKLEYGFEKAKFNGDSLTTYTVLSRNALGLVVEEMDEKYLHTRYTFGKGYSITYLDCAFDPPYVRTEVFPEDFFGLPVKVSVGYDRDDQLVTHFDYNTHDNSIRSITDPNGMVLEYEYDGFGRMKQAKRNGVQIQDVNYSNANQAGGSFSGSTAMNFVDAFNYVEEDMGWGTKGFVDPLGRKVATVNHSSSNVLVDDNIYDLYGRTLQKLKRQVGTGPIVNLGMDPLHLNFELDVAPRGRAIESAKYGRALGDGHTVHTAYCFKPKNEAVAEVAAAGQPSASGYLTGSMYLRTETTDEDGKAVVSFTDAVGNTAATIANNGTVATLFKYGPFGKATSVVNANQQAMTYQYNYVGQLISKTSPDEGTNLYAYNQSGQVICQRDAKGTIRVNRYDIYGRAREQGKVADGDDRGMLDHAQYDGMPWRPEQRRDYIFLTQAFQNAIKEKEWYYNNYALPSSLAIDQEISSGYLSAPQANRLKGRLSATVSYDLQENPVEAKFLAYNADGFLKWEVTQFGSEGLGAGEQLSVAISYPDYNLQGSYKTQNVDVLHMGGKVDYQHHYVYDSWNRIWKVYANFGNQKANGYLAAEYTYDDVLGVVKLKRLFNNDEDLGCKNQEVDGVRFLFDTRERLTAIFSNWYNHTLTYDGTVVNNSAANYNGNINSTTASYNFLTPTVVNVPWNFDAPTVYGYQYDGLNRLTRAEATTSVFDPWNPIAYSGSPALLGTSVFTYDKVGNILTQTYGNGFKVTPDSMVFGNAEYIYNYTAGTNRLESIDAHGKISKDCHDSPGQPNSYGFLFAYDANGNLTSNTKTGLSGVEYGRANLPFSIGMGQFSCHSSDGLGGSYVNLYDAADARIYKSGEFYLRDGAGHELFVHKFGDETEPFIWYVYGNERVAKIGKKLPPDDGGNGGPGYCRPLPACDGQYAQQQAAFLQNLALVATPNGITSYPTKLFRIRFCGGAERYLLQQELDGIPGNYAIVQQIDLLDPYGQFTLWTPTGLEYASLAMVLDRRNDNNGDVNLLLNGFSACKPFPCPGVQYDCGPLQEGQQGHQLSALQQQYAGITPAMVALPTRLVRIRLCSGAEVYVLLEMLPAIEGNFTVLQQIEVHGQDDTFLFSTGGGMTGTAPFSLVLQHLLEEDVLLNNYVPCMNDQPCDPTPPSCAQGMEQAQQAAITALQQAFITASAGSFTYPTHLYRIRLCSGEELYVFQEELALVPGNYLILQDIAVSDPLASPQKTYEVTVIVNGNMVEQQANFYQLINFRRGIGGSLKVVGDYEPCGDISGCSPSAPSCTPQEQADQNACLQSLLLEMQGLDPNSLQFPARLFLVRLCDGRQLYVLEQELHLLAGSYAYLQDIALTGPSQGFSLVPDNGGPQSLVTLAQLLERRLDMDFTVEGYGCSLQTVTQTLNCMYTIDQIDFGIQAVPNQPNTAKITWTKVVHRDCGYGPELILSVPEFEIVKKNEFREEVSTTYQACEVIKSTYKTIVGWSPVPFFSGGGGFSYTPAEIDTQAVLVCNEEVHLTQTICPPLCAPGFDYPDVDGDGCPDEPEIATDLNQLATAFNQAAGGLGIPLPNHFNNVEFSDGSRRVVLDNELSLLDDCIDVISTIPIGGALDEHFHVELPTGGGNASLQNVLSLRASGVMMSVGTLDPDLPTTGGEVPGGPQGVPPVPEFSFYIYDHLGNTRVLYHNEFVTCLSPRYVLEHVLDYYPYGRTMREYAHQRDRFQTTYHERDQESSLDYRGARFYDGDVGRFLSVDPKAVIFPAWSTYNYVLGDPIRLADPTGMSPETGFSGVSAVFGSEEEQENENFRRFSEGDYSVDAYLVNDAKVENVDKVVGEVDRIFRRNGFGGTVNYKVISAQAGFNLERFFEPDDKSLFLALTNYAFGILGASDLHPNTGSLGVWSDIDGQCRFESCVDVSLHKISYGNGSWRYQLGVTIAHEYAHQLDAFSMMIFEGSLNNRPFSGHYNSSINLLMEGKRFSGLKKGGNHELLPPNVKNRILRYLSN